ncbi:PmoA family protein [Leifsonia sp. ZF2019]|uniref:DUF6807 domain-containing protein n=1 Tax=Leifsonia sp. ZF2019 TaxID=2781978 RepID=UPI001CBF632F|nr:PmoA family protein [Leifsonia sp. ZF2019]UAJ77798.1 PmoA family protein [Leifsonia sp. ZF2019]
MTALRAVHEVGTAVAVLDGDVELFRYVYRPEHPQVESPRPYLHPLRTRSGALVSLYRPHDHVWHKGITWSLPVVEDENFWGGPTYVHGRGYTALPNNGSQRHRGDLRVTAEGDAVVLDHELDWVTQSGELWFAERRTLSATPVSDDAWALTFATALRNVRGAAISLGSPTTRGRENAGYGGLFWRGPRSFTGGTLVAPGVRGGDELRGQRHEWMAFAGRHDETDDASVLLMLDDASNVQHPPQWFARTAEFAALNPAQFFSEEHVVPADGLLRLRYGVGVASGTADDAPALAAAVRQALAARR